MKKGLIVLSAAATLLAGVLVPTTGFAAEGSTAKQELKQIEANANLVSPVLFVGGTTYLPSKYKFFTVLYGSDVVSVDVFGTVRALKKGSAAVSASDGQGNNQTFFFTVY